MDDEEKKDAGVSYVSIALVILISSIFSFVAFQLLDKDEPLQDSPRTYGILFEIDNVNKNVVHIRNTGLYTITELKFYIENTEISYAGSDSISPGKSEAFYLDEEQIREFSYPNTLTVTASGLMKVVEIDFSGL